MPNVSTYSEIARSVAPNTTSPVVEKLDMLRSQVDLLFDALGVLEAKLSPVLSPAGGQEEPRSPAGQQPIGALASSLGEQAQRIEYAYMRVVTLNRNLEL